MVMEVAGTLAAFQSHFPSTQQKGTVVNANPDHKAQMKCQEAAVQLEARLRGRWDFDGQRAAFYLHSLEAPDATAVNAILDAAVAAPFPPVIPINAINSEGCRIAPSMPAFPTTLQQSPCLSTTLVLCPQAFQPAQRSFVL
ncbi:hypothetical protein BDR26DRAFT_898280 [Obelidium mucronatum]|nr:hypothetical protein BDR26DRAFT_898280 [Obelidium mucronatum]